MLILLKSFFSFIFFLFFLKKHFFFKRKKDNLNQSGEESGENPKEKEEGEEENEKDERMDSGFLEEVELEIATNLELADDEEVEEVEMTRSDKFVVAPPLLILGSVKSLEEREVDRDYRMHLCLLHTTTGGLILEDRDMQLINEEFSLPQLEPISLNVAPPTAEPELVLPSSFETPPNDNDDDFDIGGGFGIQVDPFEPVTPSADLPLLSGVLQAFAEIEKEEIEDPWPLLDVYAAASQNSLRPFKKGICYKTPDSISEVQSTLTSSSLSGSFFPEFDYLYQLKIAPKKILKTKKLINEPISNEDPIQEQEQEILPDFGHGFVIFFF